MRLSTIRADRTLRKTLLGAFCLSFQPLLLNAISVPVMAYIIHRLGPEGYAQWMVATSLLAVGGVLTNLGLRVAFVRAVAADPERAEAALAEQLGLRLFLSILAGTMVIAACFLLGYPTVVLWCSVVGTAGLLLTTFATTLSDLLQSLQKMTTVAVVSLSAGLILTAVSMVVAWQSTKPIAIASAYLTGPVVSVVLLTAIVRRQVCPVKIRWSTSSSRRLAAASRFFAAQQLLFAGSSQIEAMMLPRLIGMNQFGVFTAGAMPANRLMAIPDGLAAAAYPALVSACAHGPSGGAALLRRYALFGALSGSLIAIAGMLVAELIGRVLLPGHSQLFSMVVRITIWSLPLTILELVMGYSLNACGKEATQARLAVPSAAASLLCSIALVYTFGLPGACWSMVLRPAVRGAFLLPAVLRTFRPATQHSRVAEFAPTLTATQLRKAG